MPSSGRIPSGSVPWYAGESNFYAPSTVRLQKGSALASKVCALARKVVSDFLSLIVRVKFEVL